MFKARHLVLAHFWVACVAFVAAVVLGEWQMVARSPLALWLDDPWQHDRGVTAHGTVMAYVLPTLVAMGFGYALTELTLKRPLIGVRWGWAGFGLVMAGTLLVAATMGAEHAAVLYTFYPPMIASPLYYLGILLVVAGSWVWVALTSVNLRAWKRGHRGQAVPLAMYGNVAGAYLWAWASLGAAIEVLVLILPASLGWTDTINAGLARVFFSWTLHAIVYFWLMPVYIACYTLVPRAIGGRLYSDAMGRVAFALFLVFSMPVGLHPWFAEAQPGTGAGWVPMALMAVVSVPMALTVFTLAASVGIAARLRGGRGLLGWLRALPWHEPMMLAVALAFVMLCFGSVGGLVHLGQPLHAAAHDPVLDTQWVTGPFHLIFGGAIVLMYFMIAYELWPQLTGCVPLPARAMRCQLWLWFGGMLVLATPWRWIDRLGTTPRMVYQDDSYAAIAPQAWTVVAAVLGGALLVASALLFLGILVRGRRGHAPPPVFRFALPAQACRPTPVLLNGFVLWVGMMVALTVAHYGGPIVQLSRLPEAAVPVVPVGSR